MPYFFPFRFENYTLKKAHFTKTKFLKQFSLQESDFLIVGMGAVSDRKGSDLFIEVAEKVSLHNLSIKFFWIGTFESEEQKTQIQNQLLNKNLNSQVFFLGSLEHNYYNLSPFNLFFFHPGKTLIH